MPKSSSSVVPFCNSSGVSSAGASAVSSSESLEPRRMLSAAQYDIGINANDGSASAVAKVVPVLKKLGVESLRLWATVGNFNSRTLDPIFQRAAEYSNAGFDITMEVNTADGKVPSAAAVKGWFAWTASITSVKNAVDRWEIGNEPDHYEYWNGTLAQYVSTYLAPAAESLHAAGETVVSAGPSYNPADVQTMIDDGMLNYVDYVGFHPYANGVSGVKKSVAAINAVVAGRKPLAFTEWNVRGFEGDKTSWGQAVEDAYPTIRDGSALNYYFALKVQNSLAGPGGILTSAFAYNQPFYNAFATFDSANTTPTPTPTPTPPTTTPTAPTTPTTGSGNTPAGTGGSISGTVFYDADADGVLDAGEFTASRTVYLDANANGKLDAGETSTLSSSKGVYTFSGLAKGTYKVSRVFPAGYKLSNNAAGYVSTTVATSQKVTGVNLGTTTVVASTPVTTTPTAPSAPTAPATPTAPIVGPTITGFRILNASTGEPIAWLKLFNYNATLTLATLPAGGINIQAVTGGVVSSVKVTALGKTSVETAAPFTLLGSSAWTPAAGSYAFAATAYAGPDATGAVGNTLALTVSFV